MNRPKDPHSFETQLADDTYEGLSLEENLRLVDIINRKIEGDREGAKMAIWNAHLRQIRSETRRQIIQLRQKAGLSVHAERIKADAISEIFNDIAAEIYKDLSGLAASGYEGRTISGLIRHRVSCRIADHIRQYYLKRNTNHDGSAPTFEGLRALENEEIEISELTKVMDKMMAEEMLRLAAKLSLDETANQILSIVQMAIARREDFDISMLAERLGKPRQTVRSGYMRAIEALKKMVAPSEEEIGEQHP